MLVVLRSSSPSAWAALGAVARAAQDRARNWVPPFPRRSKPGRDAGRSHQAVVVEVDPDISELTRSPLSRHLVELIRRFYLSEIQSPASRIQPDQSIQLLCAIERVAHSLDPDWQHFADRLSGPNGLELVVEVAHDIRSPPTSILFLAETLQRGRSGAINEIQERQLA